jgi:DNA polymerase-3 subunit gamma/tau
MASKALAIKYRPMTWGDLIGQDSIKLILENQIKSNTIKQGYLFVGSAGTGKTTSARIFASMINKGQGHPIELDAASNNSVDDIRNLTENAQTKSLDSEYKVFILDEVHVLSNNAWQALLKTLEEPPAKSIFILCTTNPEKIPNTILSRVQRYNFQRISLDGIFNRLRYIIERENDEGANITYTDSALEMIAKIADGGMRDAITLMDKCLSYSTNLTLDVCINALGTADYTVMMNLLDALLTDDREGIIQVIEDLHNSGKDLKLFCRQLTNFTLDVIKLSFGCGWEYVGFPLTNDIKWWIKTLTEEQFTLLDSLLSRFVQLNSDIKYVSNPKYYIEAEFMVH